MKKGFTLVELLAVVLIIGLLAGVAVPKYTRSVRRAEMIEGLTNGKTIFDSVIRYKAVNSVLPSFDQIDVGFIGVEEDTEGNVFIDGNVFTDVNFTYVIQPEEPAHLKIQNNKDDYYLQMFFPVVTEQGVSAPIYCCPADNWVCKNASTIKSPEETCTEIR
ncbi:MAG: type II secretion system protein [Elusimicrobiaceae bacterium]|nr:type II secretion system protein [Elusimicrobiaceae bacterium]